MVEPEVAFIDLNGLLQLAENLVSFVTEAVLQKNRAQLETLGANIAALEKIKPPFYRLTYTEAVDILTGDKTREFLAKQLEDFKNTKSKIENRINELEQQQKGKIKQWQEDKISAELIELRGNTATLVSRGYLRDLCITLRV